MKKILEFGPNLRKVEIGEVMKIEQELELEFGVKIKDFDIAYQTYGSLNNDKSNAIMVFHAFTGDQFVASKNPVTDKDGWWSLYVGSGLAINTDVFFVICANVIGGCLGSFGPKEINSKTGKRWNMDFPIVTINDMVRAQKMLLDNLGIKKLHAAIGGSMGGMQALSFASLYPEMTKSIISIAASHYQSPQNIAFNEVARQSIVKDKDWQDGLYLEKGTYPSSGLSIARMCAHITYLSKDALQNKFGRNLQNKDMNSRNLKANFQVEGYLEYQGSKFTERFDPNSYLYLTRAVDYFDMTNGGRIDLASAFSRARDVKFCIISFSDDILYNTSDAKILVRALNAASIDASFIEISGKNGHDSFLLENDEAFSVIKGFLR